MKGAGDMPGRGQHRPVPSQGASICGSRAGAPPQTGAERAAGSFLQDPTGVQHAPLTPQLPHLLPISLWLSRQCSHRADSSGPQAEPSHSARPLPGARPWGLEALWWGQRRAPTLRKSWSTGPSCSVHRPSFWHCPAAPPSPEHGAFLWTAGSLASHSSGSAGCHPRPHAGRVPLSWACSQRQRRGCVSREVKADTSAGETWPSDSWWGNGSSDARGRYAAMGCKNVRVFSLG